VADILSLDHSVSIGVSVVLLLKNSALKSIIVWWMKSLSVLCHILYDLEQFCGLMQISDLINTISWSLMPGSGLPTLTTGC